MGYFHTFSNTHGNLEVTLRLSEEDNFVFGCAHKQIFSSRPTEIVAPAINAK